MTGEVDGILAEGVPGVAHLRRLVDLARRCSTRDWPDDTFFDAYDQQRGIQLDRLRVDIEQVDAVLATLATERDFAQAHILRLESAWNDDPGADGARANLRSVLERATNDSVALADVQGALTAAARAIPAVLQGKAELTLALAADVDGKSISAIDVVIGTSTSDTTLPLGLRRVGELGVAFPELPLVTLLAQAPFSATATQRVIDHCRSWCDEVFVPTVLARLRVFEQSNMFADNAIRTIYATVTKAMNAVDDAPYPSPASVQSDPRPGDRTTSEVGTPPSAPNAVAPSASVATSNVAAPNSAVPAATPSAPIPPVHSNVEGPVPNVVQYPEAAVESGPRVDQVQVGALLTGLITAAGEVVEGLVEAVLPAVLSVVEQAAVEEPAEQPVAFDLGADRIVIDKPADDTHLDLVTTDQDGRSQSFQLAIDDTGTPVVTDVDGTERGVVVRNTEATPAEPSATPPTEADEPVAPAPAPDPHTEGPVVRAPNNPVREDGGAQREFQPRVIEPRAEQQVEIQPSGPDPVLDTMVSDSAGAALPEAGDL
ncbi:hypothetical protein ACHIPZ_00025 [Antrihabitans sp. NCIMB 15449]|uniref:DUF222 domain-containing protein n=1 Tax=Antrihabitans spumae TaxID=3373370 RepID=A0ABW7JFU5_9NOCA